MRFYDEYFGGEDDWNAYASSMIEQGVDPITGRELNASERDLVERFGMDSLPFAMPDHEETEDGEEDDSLSLPFDDGDYFDE